MNIMKEKREGKTEEKKRKRECQYELSLEG
jgi:hypothetical protein